LKSLLSEADFEALQESADAQIEAIKGLGSQGIETTPEQDQYLYPMGMAVLCHLSYGLPQMVYVAELRSGVTVHPSLRPLAQAIGGLIKELHPSLNLYIDESADSWSFKRGQQDITAKEIDAA